jgi:3-hydroxyisobutyrate dehydrogenase
MSANDLVVGFIGLGDQGRPMAERIVAGGYETHLWARRPEALDGFGPRVHRTATPSALGAACDVVGVCVFDDAAVEQVVAGPDGLLAGMTPGSVIAVHSTIHPHTCLALAQQAVSSGVAVVDAPVSGGRAGAERGELLVFMGGDDGPVSKCQPIFRTYSKHLVHVGQIGDGQRVKLVNNLLLMAQFTLTRRGVCAGCILGDHSGETG